MSKVNQRCPNCQKVLDPGHFADADAATVCGACVRWLDRTPPFQCPTRGGTVTIVSINPEGAFVAADGCRYDPVAGALGFYDAWGENSLRNMMEPGPGGAPSDGSPRQRRDPKSWTPTVADLEGPAD